MKNEQLPLAMATETERLSDLKCGDCIHRRLSGCWAPQYVCEIDGFTVDKDGPACISVLPKNTKHYGKSSD